MYSLLVSDRLECIESNVNRRIMHNDAEQVPLYQMNQL